MRLDRRRPEFPFYKFVMVEIFIRQAKMAGIGGFRPAGFFVRTAFGTGFGMGWHFAPQLGQTSGDMEIYDLRYTIYKTLIPR